MEQVLKINSRPYNRPSSGFVSYYDKIRFNGEVVINSYPSKKGFQFRRIWENGFGGGISDCLDYPRQVEVEPGTIIISKEDYKIIYSEAKKIKRREYQKKRREQLKVIKENEARIEARNQRIRDENNRRKQIQVNFLQSNDSSKYLFVDTETTGLPKNFNTRAFEKAENWPSIVSIAWVLTEANGQVIDKAYFIIKPKSEKWGAVDIHGITYGQAMEKGIESEQVFIKFGKAIQSSRFLVAHNAKFDREVLEAYLTLNGFSDVLEELIKRRWHCTMEESAPYVGIPLGDYDFKWPSLQELHQKVFDRSFENPHNALADIQATTKCFFKLKEMGIVMPLEKILLTANASSI